MPDTQTDKPASDFESQAKDQSGGSFLGEFFDFITHNKKWWLTPIIVVLLLVAALLLISPAAAPFIYTLF